MADEKPKDQDGKDTNRTFTQSEHDKAISDAVNKALEPFKDYESVKTKLAELDKAKAAADAASMTELQKTQKMVEDLTGKLSQTTAELSTWKTTAAKAEVLSAPEFALLPKAYRNSISGSTAEEIAKSAKDILAEFQEDVKKLGAKPGNPPPPPDRHHSETGPKKPAEALAENLARKFNPFAKK
jgi:hypothetical protein